MTIAGAVVGGKGCCHHAPGGDLPADDPGPLGRHAEADERDLRRVDDPEHGFDAALSEVGDRDRRVRKLGAAQGTAAHGRQDRAAVPSFRRAKSLSASWMAGAARPPPRNRDRRPDMDAGAWVPG
jgi:hypothetical protein